MKKIITLILTVALLLTAMVSCSSNDTKVAVIWSEQNDDYLFSISDALDRAFYIKRVKYKHYDAEGNSGKQLELVDQAIASGTKVLVVNPTDAATATAVVSKARAANLPVVFLCNDEASFEAIKLAGYEKAYTVDVDAGTITSVLGNKIASDLAADYKKYDRNGDGKITIASLGIVGAATVDEINTELKRLKEGDAENKPLRSLKKIDNPQVVLMDAKYYGSTSVETVDRMFADDPGEVYQNMDEPTKYAYRQQVARLATEQKSDEAAVCLQAIRKAKEECRQVGFFLDFPRPSSKKPLLSRSRRQRLLSHSAS